MKKEILLYTSVNSYSSSDFIAALEEAGDNDVCVRINGDGGDPEYGFGMIAKFNEFKGNKLVKVDCKAHSMYVYFLCCADDSEALEVSSFTVHRAAYPEWYEGNPDYFTAEKRADVERINSYLRKLLEAKIDVAKFEELKGVKMKDIFSLNGRLDVTLTAAEAKKIGLINRVVKITAEKAAEIDSLVAKIAAEYTGVKLAAEYKPENKKPINMTIAEFKTAHPEVFAQAVAQGVAQEKARVEACLVYIDIDADGVKAAIESGVELTGKQMAEFSLKAVSKNALGVIEKEAAKTTGTQADSSVEKTAKEKQVADFEAAVRKEAGLK